MAFSCPICSDSLTRSPPDPTNTEGAKISCAPCGHLFHAFCIQKWLGGTLATSSQCPCCRVSIPRKKCLPLYPTIQDDSLLDDSVHADIMCNHGPILDDLRLKVQKYERDLAQAKQLNSTLSDDYERHQSKLKSERLKYEQLLIKYKQMESLETYADELKDKLTTAQVELSSLRTFQSVIDSIRNDIDYKEQDYSLTRQSLDDLKTINGILTRELKSARNTHKESLRMQDSLRADCRRAKNEVTKLKNEKEELENRLAISRIELEELQKAAGEDVLEKTSAPSTTPNRKRKSLSDNKLFRLDDSVIEISPDVDDDIMIVKPFHSGQNRGGIKLGRKQKSSNDLNTAFTTDKSKQHEASSSSLKNCRSASDVLSSDIFPVASASNANKKPRKKTTAEEDSSDGLASLGFSSNLKASLPGLSVTPARSYRRPGPTSDFGIPKPPKVLKK